MVAAGGRLHGLTVLHRFWFILGWDRRKGRVARQIDAAGEFFRTAAIRMGLRDQPPMGGADGLGVRIGRNAEQRPRLVHIHSAGRPRSLSPRPSPMSIAPRPDRTAATYPTRSEEHTSELQSLMRISYAVFCLKK